MSEKRLKMMTTYLSESQLEEKLCKKIKELGGMALKFISPGRAGVPDRIILMPCRKIYFVEMKSLRGEINPIQEYVVEKFKNLGFEVKILNSDEKIKNFLQEIYNDQLQRKIF